eukprot:3022564-Alexandrium_andersonii.AAC.1
MLALDVEGPPPDALEAPEAFNQPQHALGDAASSNEGFDLVEALGAAIDESLMGNAQGEPNTPGDATPVGELLVDSPEGDASAPASAAGGSQVANGGSAASSLVQDRAPVKS